MRYDYINIDNELLFESLTFINTSNNRLNHWERYNPSLKEIDSLFKEYECEEFMENYYDSEPDYDDEEFKMYMDYIATHDTGDNLTGTGLFEALLYSGDEERKKSKHFAAKEYTEKQLERAYKKIRKQQDEYEQKRISFNNWQEPHFEGNWGATQKQVDRYAKKCMKDIKKTEISTKDRFWIITEPESERKKGAGGWNKPFKGDIKKIFYYGRDYFGVDYIWIMQKKDASE